MTVKWARNGGYECSTRGDPRFSALNATLYDGRTIEMHYQCDVKGYQPGGRDWSLGKGRRARDPKTDLWKNYLALWSLWALMNPPLLAELRTLAAAHGNVLSDRFATTPVNQAHALAELLNRSR